MWKSNFIWFAVAAAALGLAFLVKSPYGAFALYAFLLLLFLANFTSRLWISGLDCSRTVSEDTLRQGEEAEVHVTVRNRRPWPIPWLFIEDGAHGGLSLHGTAARLTVLMPGQTVRMNYRLRAVRRGYHPVGPLLMETGDLFGLQKRFRTGRRRDYISVLPTAAYIETFSISSRRPQGPVRVSNRAYEDPTRITGLREYVQGDPLNRIHWKASAHHNQLMVKQNEPSSLQGGTLVLDLFAPWFADETGEERMELAITVTASIAFLLQASGEQVGLATNARDAAQAARYEQAEREVLSRGEADAVIEESDRSDALNPLEVPTRRSPLQSALITENLARVLPTDGLDLRGLLAAVQGRLRTDAAVLPVVTKLTEDAALALAMMRESGYVVTIFLAGRRADYDQAASLCLPHQIDVLHIEHERDLYTLSPEHIGR